MSGFCDMLEEVFWWCSLENWTKGRYEDDESTTEDIGRGFEDDWKEKRKIGRKCELWYDVTFETA